MAFEQLTQRLTQVLSNIKKTPKLNEANMEAMLKEIRLALLEADVNVKVIVDFLNKVKEKALGVTLIDKVAPAQMVVKIVNDELVALLGSKVTPLNLNAAMPIFFMVGLQGSGKTTSAAKIALYLKNQKIKPLMIAADMQRLAAIDQLITLGQSINVDVFSLPQPNSPLEVLKQGLAYAKANQFQAVLVDTAGRLAVDQELMSELATLVELVHPQEILLTVDAMSGQDIVSVAQTFKETIPITGIMATKFDSDARGGGVLSVTSLTNVPVKFVGVGEKLDELELFYPDRMASRILGMGDVVSLVEQAQAKLDEDVQNKATQRLMSGAFDLHDMLTQLQQMDKLGSLKGMMKLLPNAASVIDKIDDEKASKSMATSKAIILSMTKQERSNPQLLKANRKIRIAKGSGTTITQVNQLLAQFEKTKQQVSMMLKANQPKLKSMGSGSNTKPNPNKKKKKKKR